MYKGSAHDLCFQNSRKFCAALRCYRGKKAENTLDYVHIFTNKNVIPFDKRKPFDPSGIRLGSPALTTRGLVESDFTAIGEYIVKALKSADDQSALNRIKEDVLALCAKYN